MTAQIPDVGAQIEHRVRNEVHTCVRPRCPARSRVAYAVAAPMRFAGRDLVPGDFVDLCPLHDLELRGEVDHAQVLGFGTQFDDLAWFMGDVNPLERLREWEWPS